MSETNKLAEYLGFEIVYLDGFAYIQEEGAQGPEIKREANLEERTMWTDLVRLSAELSGLQANEKVLLAQIQGHTQWRERITKASEQAYGESAVRYKFSLTKSGKCMNTFPKEIDGRWFALVPAEDDGHIGHVARIAALEQELEKVRKDAGRWAHACKGNYKQINVCSWDNDAYEFVGYGMKKEAIDAIADAEIAAMKGTPCL